MQTYPEYTLSMVLFSCCSKNHQSVSLSFWKMFFLKPKCFFCGRTTVECLLVFLLLDDWFSLRKLKAVTYQMWSSHLSPTTACLSLEDLTKFVFANGSVRGTDSGRIGLSDSLQEWFYFFLKVFYQITALQNHNRCYQLKPHPSRTFIMIC